MWIETNLASLQNGGFPVTPHAGVWIETELIELPEVFFWSLPMRECGLKQVGRAVIILCREVTPHAGVWIETRGN